MPKESGALRPVLYRWLARVFETECDSIFISWCQSDQGDAFFKLLDSIPDFQEGVRDIVSIIVSSQPQEELLLQLSGSYSSLFYGINRFQGATPYESAYMGETGQLFGEATSSIANILIDNGLELSNTSEPADHVSIHLSLMHLFIQKQFETDLSQEIVEEWLLKEKNFVEQHMNNWIPRFAANCVRFDQLGFYRGAAKILEADLRIWSVDHLP